MRITVKEISDKLWNQVEAHEINGLPKTALEALKVIETKAIAENNTDQRIKVLLFKSKFALLLEEDAQLSIINSFKAEIAKSQAPTKKVRPGSLRRLHPRSTCMLLPPTLQRVILLRAPKPGQE